MSKKAVIIAEGNQKQTERLIHELQKLVSQANSEPELTASIQSESVESSEHSVTFASGTEHGGKTD